MPRSIAISSIGSELLSAPVSPARRTTHDAVTRRLLSVVIARVLASISSPKSSAIRQHLEG